MSKPDFISDRLRRLERDDTKVTVTDLGGGRTVGRLVFVSEGPARAWITVERTNGSTVDLNLAHVVAVST